MKNIAKTVLAVSLMAGLAGCASLPKISKMDVPKKFLAYQKTECCAMAPLMLWKKLYIQRNYDIDGDKDMDVAELYLPPNAKPVFYGFDLDDDEKFTTAEMLLDLKMDGINGNEERLDRYLAKEAEKQKENQKKQSQANPPKGRA